MKKILAMGSALALLLLGLAFLVSSPVSAQPEAGPDAAGSSPDNPIVLDSADDVPEGAVQTGQTKDKCATTTTWSLTESAVPETETRETRYSSYTEPFAGESHEEYQYSRHVEEVEGTLEQRYAKTIEHPAVPQETANQYKWSRRVYTVLAKPSVPGTPSHYELESIWRVEGDVPEGEGWSICNQRIIKDHGTPYTKEYQWHQLIPGTPYQPAVRPQFYYQNTDYLPEGVSPSNEWPADAVDVAEWRRGGKSVIITKPYEKAWTETIFYTGKPDGSNDEGDAAYVTYPPGGGYSAYGESRWKDGIEPAEAYDEFYNGEPENTRSEDDAAWVTYTPAGDWTQSAQRTVVDEEAREGFWAYFVLGGEVSLAEDDATWVIDEDAPVEGWVKFDERMVSAEDGVDEVVTYYSYNDGKECGVPPTEEPPTDVTPTADTPDQPAPQAEPKPNGVLPNTGGPDAMWGALAASLIALGGGLLLWRRRAV
ncbi:MAG: LPXTG cell wall anchor domain-containing protein [Nocardioides sp.]|nr:LPXTG cell wall anchor domain-containing protein [Nocardioides sp.]